MKFSNVSIFTPSRSIILSYLIAGFSQFIILAFHWSNGVHVFTCTL